MKLLWIIISAVSLVLAIHQTIIQGFKESVMLYGIAIIGYLMYIVRKRLAEQERKKNK